MKTISQTPRSFRTALASAPAGYLTAFAVGVALVLSVFPHWALVGGLPPGAPPRADFGKDVLGQLYFFSQPWLSQPGSSASQLLIDRRLDAPWGASIALTDSIPLLTVLTKLLRPLLPPFEQTISLYQAAAWALQPVAAVFALRSAGERRWLPAFAVALLAASMPTFLFRLWHAALGGHFLLLAMLGLYLRIVRGSVAALVCAGVLQVALLLIHPYLMLMASLVLLAAPLSLFLRGDVRWRRTLPAVAVSSGAVVLIGQLLGYWGAGSDGGFGYYSMNLAAPFWPTFSALIPGIPYAPADGTGGQAEGYQYLGLGLLGLLAVSALGWARWWAHIRRHPGLALVCIGLCALAVTNWVFFLRIRLVHIPLPSLVFSQVRASGRLFWPIAYALLITSALVTLRVFPRAGSLIVLAAALVQFADAAQLRRLDHDSLGMPTAYPFDQQRLSAILRAHDRLTVIPELPCNGGGTPIALDLLWLAGRTRMLINTMYMAREAHAEVCLPPEAMDTRPAADEIRVILPGFDQALAALPDSAADCRVFQPYVLCTRHADLLAGLPAAAVRSVPMSVTLPIRAGEAGADALMAGWTDPGAVAGAWSTAPSVFLGATLTPVPPGPVRLRIRARAMPRPVWLGWATPHRPVTVWAGTRRIAEWSVGPLMSDFEAVVPADWIQRKGAVIVELRTSRPASTLDLGRTPDPRRFGIWMESLSFSPVDR